MISHASERAKIPFFFLNSPFSLAPDGHIAKKKKKGHSANRLFDGWVLCSPSQVLLCPAIMYLDCPQASPPAKQPALDGLIVPRFVAGLLPSALNQVDNSVGDGILRIGRR